MLATRASSMLQQGLVQSAQSEDIVLNELAGRVGSPQGGGRGAAWRRQRKVNS